MPDAYFTTNDGKSCRIAGFLSGSVRSGTTVQSPFTANSWIAFTAAYCPTNTNTNGYTLRLRINRNNAAYTSRQSAAWAPLYNGPAGSAPVARSVSATNLGSPINATGAYQACADMIAGLTVIKTTCTQTYK